MILVTYKVQDGEKEYYEYSFFSMGTKSDCDEGVIKGKALIKEVYSDDEEEVFENNYDDDRNTFEDYSNAFITVHSVEDITPEELDVLYKFGVVYK